VATFALSVALLQTLVSCLDRWPFWGS